MLGELPPEPRSLFSAEINRSRTARIPRGGFDVNISNSSKLYLVVQDSLSTAPDKSAPLWVNAKLVGPHGTVPLSSFKPLQISGLRDGEGKAIVEGSSTTAVHDAIRVKLSSVLVYNVAGRGFTRFSGAPGFENMHLAQGETVQAQFFIFDQEPNMDRLVTPRPGTPLPLSPPVKTRTDVEDRVFRYALGRAPSPAERRIADAALRDPAHPDNASAEGLADLLWAILMKPEFQLIY